MSKKNNTRSNSKSQDSRSRRARGFDSRHTLGPVATLVVRKLATRDSTLDEITEVHDSGRRALRALIDRGLVVERVLGDGTIKFSLTTSARRLFAATLRKSRAPSGVAVVLVGVGKKDHRRSRRTVTFKPAKPSKVSSRASQTE